MTRTMFVITLLATMAPYLAAAEGDTPPMKAETVLTPACPSCAAGETPAAADAVVSQWLEPAERTKLTLDFESTNQDGKKIKLSEITNKPTVVTFFYSRCENPRKCPLAVSTLAELAAEIKHSALNDKVRILALTYDPEFDTAEVLKKYGLERGLKFSESVQMLRPEPKQKQKVLDALKASVNYNAEGVNIHSLQLVLIDANGRFVRNYHSVIWDNKKVIKDLQKLVANPQ
jgi:cytochrome oxidase Cu insertion factor (SCO1/SenC/PrrC family)